jgi:hypothetical protein
MENKLEREVTFVRQIARAKTPNKKGGEFFTACLAKTSQSISQRGFDSLLLVYNLADGFAGKRPLLLHCREIDGRGFVFRSSWPFLLALGFLFRFLALLILSRTLFLALGEAGSTSTWHGHTSQIMKILVDSAHGPTLQARNSHSGTARKF